MENHFTKISIIRLIILIVIFYLGLYGSIFAKEPDWYLKLKQIKILQSTKQDVENLFPSLKGRVSHKFKNSEEFHYIKNQETLFASYSLGMCSKDTSENEKYAYDVKNDVLLYLSYTPQKPVKISELKLDLSSFGSYKDGTGLTYYNFDLGIEYGVFKDKVESVEIFPTNSMKHLLCKTIEDKN